MIHCQMDKGSAFQVICEELSSVQAGLGAFTAHLTSNNEKDSNATLTHQSPTMLNHNTTSLPTTYPTAVGNKSARMGIRPHTIPVQKP